MRGSPSSTIDPAGVRPYFGGPFEGIAAARSNRTPRTSARHCSNNWVQASSSALAGRVALQQGHVVRNVAELVDRIPADPKPADTFTPAELQQVLDHIDGDRYAVAWQLALTGLRRGEVAGLRWSDIDLDARTLQIASTRLRFGRRADAQGRQRARYPVPRCAAYLRHAHASSGRTERSDLGVAGPRIEGITMQTYVHSQPDALNLAAQSFSKVAARGHQSG
jgi:integrase